MEPYYRKKTGEALHRLTPREREIAELAALGLSNPDIAKRLGITTASVSTRIGVIVAKLQVKRKEIGKVLEKLG